MYSEGGRRQFHRQAQGRSRRLRCGVTMLDLVMSVLIVGILAAVATPRLAHRIREYQADAAAQRLASDLRLAQKHARTTGSGETVAFDASLNVYTLSSVTSPDSSGGAYSVDLMSYPYHAQIASVSLGGPQAVTFNGFGFPDSGGAVTVGADGASRTVQLDPATGKVVVGD